MKKGGYVDGFVIPVLKTNTAKYTKMAEEGKKIWLKFGALDYKECIFESERQDMKSAVTFPKLAKVKQGETVWFSFVVYKSKAHRDAVNKKVMAYFTKKYSKEAMKDMPFDMKRFAYAGFKVVVGA